MFVSSEKLQRKVYLRTSHFLQEVILRTKALFGIRTIIKTCEIHTQAHTTKIIRLFRLKLKIQSETLVLMEAITQSVSGGENEILLVSGCRTTKK